LENIGEGLLHACISSLYFLLLFFWRFSSFRMVELIFWNARYLTLYLKKDFMTEIFSNIDKVNQSVNGKSYMYWYWVSDGSWLWLSCLFNNEINLYYFTQEFYVCYVYNANRESAYHLQSTALIFFTILQTINGSWQCKM
jgi:hypothetical protein